MPASHLRTDVYPKVAKEHADGMHALMNAEMSNGVVLVADETAGEGECPVMALWSRNICFFWA